MSLAAELSSAVGAVRACAALSIPRASYYRWREPRRAAPRERRCSPRRLSAGERAAALEILNSPRFVDRPPVAIHATLLDEGIYVCSPRSMYRILEEQGDVTERRNQRRHPQHKKPELLATGPNQVWSWDITKLLGPAKWVYYCLYVILDIFSRYIVGWMLADRETAALAKRLIGATVLKYAVEPRQLTIHADRGPAMIAKPVARLFEQLGIERSHSRPHVSNDNPYSEAQFKTLKYAPAFPDRFASIEHAHEVCARLIAWYNHEHRHAGINLFTPVAVHFGEHETIRARRQAVVEAAFARHPERFVRGPPHIKGPPQAVWINPPAIPSGNRTLCGAPGATISGRPDPQYLPNSCHCHSGTHATITPIDPLPDAWSNVTKLERNLSHSH